MKRNEMKRNEMCKKRKVKCEKQKNQRKDLHAVSFVQNFLDEIESRHVLCHFVTDDCYDFDFHETKMNLHVCIFVSFKTSLTK